MIISLVFSLFCLLAHSSANKTEEYLIRKITFLPIQSSINPATYHFIKSELKKLSFDNGDFAIIKMNTPGGLVTTTKDILTLMGESDFPIAVWITPEGASATSAGAIISSGAHFLFMSEGTNIGAATPIDVSGDIEKKDAKAKAVNDLSALVSSLAKSRGRDHKNFELMITEAKSFDANQAKKEKIIDDIINSNNELIEAISDSQVRLKDKNLKIKLSDNLKFQTAKMGVGISLLNIFAHPTTAYLLFLIGAALIYFEIQAPGGFIAGGLGAVALILAAIGFQVLPLNFGALGLIILSFVLFVLEIYITSYGILALCGVCSMIFGSLFLFDTPDSYLAIDPIMIFSASLAVILYTLGVGYLIFKTPRDRKFFEEKNKRGHVTKILDKENHLYQVKVEGEIWNAKSNQELNENDNIIVTNKESMTLKIKKVTQGEN